MGACYAPISKPEFAPWRNHRWPLRNVKSLVVKPNGFTEASKVSKQSQTSLRQGYSQASLKEFQGAQGRARCPGGVDLSPIDAMYKPLLNHIHYPFSSLLALNMAFMEPSYALEASSSMRFDALTGSPRQKQKAKRTWGSKTANAEPKTSWLEPVSLRPATRAFVQSLFLQVFFALCFDQDPPSF